MTNTVNPACEMALTLSANGLSVIPIRADGSKAPAVKWQEFQSRIPEADEIRAMFRHGHGIAIITGVASGNLEVLDFECDAPFEDYCALVRDLDSNLIDTLPHVKTPSGGHHLYFRADRIEGNLKLAFQVSPNGRRKIIIETRARGGYVLTAGSPPACHPANRPYELVETVPLTDIPRVTEVQRSILLDAARSFDQVIREAPCDLSKVTDGARPGDIFNRRTTWAEILEPHGWTFVKSSGTVGYWKRPGKTDPGISATSNYNGTDRLHVFTTNAWPFESGASYSKFCAHALLSHGGDMKAAASALSPLPNYRVPALAERKLLGKGEPEWRPDIEGKNSDGMQFARLGDLLAEEDAAEQFVVDGLLPAGGDSLLVAKPKAGKSTLARCLALAVAGGDDFLGRRTSPGPVLYLALEEKRSEVREHFRSMGACGDEQLLVCFAASPDDRIGQLRDAIATVQPVLVVVDPLFRFLRVTDGNAYTEVTNALEPLHQLARHCGAHVLAVHHSGKADRQGGDGVLGSTALFAAVDTLMIMKRTERFRTLSTIQRYGTDLEETKLDYDTETRTLSAGATRDEADRDEAAAAIIRFLKEQSGPVDEAAIHDSVEGRKAVKVQALRKAVQAGAVIRTGEGVRGNSYRYGIPSSLVPVLGREQTKEESESGASHSFERADARSRTLVGSRHGEPYREPASDEDREAFEL